MGTVEDGFRFGERVETVTEATKPIEVAQPRRFCRYPAFKDSGIEWLGAIPANWGVRRLTDVANLVNGFPFDSKLFDRSHGIPLVRIRDLFNTTTEVNWSGDPVSEAGIRDGDILIGMDGDFSVAWWAQGPALLNQRLCCLRARSVYISQRYIFYCLPFPLKALNDVTYATTVKHLSSLDVLKFRLPIPSHDEQRGIAAFLDRETARIDGLVKRKERLIELLQEKRIALVTRAVTRGLDPNDSMQESGVEWLGEIPAHWELKRVKWVAQLESGHTPDKKVDAYWKDGDVPWVSLNDTGHLKNKDYISETEYYTNELGLKNSSARLLPPRSVVFSRDATIGLCAITERTMAVSQHFIAWICGEEIIPEYLLRVFDAMQNELERLTMGATLRTIGMPEVKTLTTPVPPVDEQEIIVNHIRQECLRLDLLIAKIRQAINHLKEFRTALISAAVTGKIDVREEAS